MEEKETFNISEHFLVPNHVKLTEEEKKALLEKYNISINQLPEMFASDPAIAPLNAQVGEVIDVVRKSPTTGETHFCRVVING